MQDSVSWLLLTFAFVLVPLGYIAVCFRMARCQADGFSFLAQFILFGTFGGWCLALGYFPSVFSGRCFLLLLTAAPLASLASAFVLRMNKDRNRFDEVAMWLGYAYGLALLAVLGLAVVGFVLFALVWKATQ